MSEQEIKQIKKEHEKLVVELRTKLKTARRELHQLRVHYKKFIKSVHGFNKNTWDNKQRHMKELKEQNQQLKIKVQRLEKKNDALLIQIPSVRMKMCGKKKSYRSYSQASKAAEKHHGTQYNTYKCPICFCYHNTSKVEVKK